MTWYRLHIECVERRDEVIAAIFETGAPGVQELEEGLLTYFDSAEAARSAIGAARRVAPGLVAHMSVLAEEDWSAAWKRGVRASALGSLRVAPPWLASEGDAAHTVIIDPGMAFGTGDHPTTQGAGRLLEGAMRPGAVVADLGTGSGVLAIVAAKLGASSVFAIETDPEALGNARDNIARNGVSHVVHLLEGDAAILLPLVAPVDIVVANIVSSVLTDLLPAMREALREGGRVILAGLLMEERDHMTDIFAAGGWDVEHEDTEGEWWSVQISRV